MSNSELFIEEVTSEVRRDRLYALFRRYAWVGVLAVVLIVGAAAFREWTIARDRAAAEEFGDAILAAYALESETARIDALRGIQAESGDARALVRMLAADEALQVGRTEEAAELLDSTLADDEASDLYRDLASFKSVVLRSGSLPPEETIRLLEPIALPGRPFRVLAQERMALALLEAGRATEAEAMFRSLLNDAESPVGLRQRVAQLLPAIGSELSSSQDPGSSGE